MYMALILFAGTYQFLDLLTILLIVAVALPAYLIVMGIRCCSRRINSTRFIKVLKPRTFEPSQVPGDHECKICMGGYSEGDQIITLPCNRLHHYHGVCIKTWLGISLSCPTCRESFSDLSERRLNRMAEQMNEVSWRSVSTLRQQITDGNTNRCFWKVSHSIVVPVGNLFQRVC